MDENLQANRLLRCSARSDAFPESVFLNGWVVSVYRFNMSMDS